MTESEYQPLEIEPRWQQRWDETGAFVAEMEGDNPYYVLEMFPYPSGRIHMGHVRNYSIGDAVARFLRRRGHQVLPDRLGRVWDAGRERRHQGQQPSRHVDLRQHQGHARPVQAAGAELRLGPRAGDLSPRLLPLGSKRSSSTCWRRASPFAPSNVNWCPHDQTVLANEQVVDGGCWRCSTVVEQRDLEAWSIRITDYAQELLDDIDTLEQWPDAVRAMQRWWIGRSVGARIGLPVIGAEDLGSVEVFTSAPHLHGLHVHELGAGASAGDGARSARREGR